MLIVKNPSSRKGYIEKSFPYSLGPLLGVCITFWKCLCIYKHKHKTTNVIALYLSFYNMHFKRPTIFHRCLSIRTFRPTLFFLNIG